MKFLINRLKNSLTARLLLTFSLMSFFMIMLVVGILVGGFASQWRGNIQPHMLNYLNYIHQDIGSPPSVEKAQALAERLPINIYIQGGGINYSSTTLPLALDELDFINPNQHHHNPAPFFQSLDESLSFAEENDRLFMRHEVGEYFVYYELLYNEREKKRQGFIKRVLLVLLIILALSFYFLHRLFRPVSDIKKGVARIQEGDLSYRLPVRGKNDLATLSARINEMASDIEKMLEAKRQLLLALSHELRSPLTRSKLATQMLPPSNYQESIQSDIEEMEQLITIILDAERINGRHKVLNIETVDIASLCHSVLQEFEPDSIEHDLQKALPKAQWDATRMGLALRNLLSNALHYSAEGAPKPKLSVQCQKNRLVIEVQNTGEVIDADKIELLTEAFYRVDSSRTRNTGGLGLGLYITKMIVQAHSGEINIRSTAQEGTVVSLRMPLA